MPIKLNKFIDPNKELRILKERKTKKMIQITGLEQKHKALNQHIDRFKVKEKQIFRTANR